MKRSTKDRFIESIQTPETDTESRYHEIAIEQDSERILTFAAASAMREKLRESRRKGRTGWWKKECTIEHLRELLHDHVEKGDMVDVMNIAAMICAKECYNDR